MPAFTVKRKTMPAKVIKIKFEYTLYLYQFLYGFDYFKISFK